jgi:hypothetical protein
MPIVHPPPSPIPSTPTIQDNESELAPHPHRMQLWGEVGGLRFPSLCANCGRAAEKRLTYSKIFRKASGDDTPNSYVTTLVQVPFCDTCIAQHRADGHRPSLLANVLSRLLTVAQVVGVAGFGLACTIAGYHAVGKLLHLQMTYFYALGLLALFFGLLTWGLYSLARDGTETMRAEGQAGITRAFDFSHSTAAPFESIRFTCTMRDEHFAAAFRELNQKYEYIADSKSAAANLRKSKRQTWIAALVFGSIVLVMMIRESLK